MTFPRGKSLNKLFLSQAVAFMVCVVTFTTFTFGQLSAADQRGAKTISDISDTEIKLPGNSLTSAQGPFLINPTTATCKYIQDLGEDGVPQYAHMTTAWEMWIYGGSPNGTFPLASIPPVMIQGGMDPNPALSMTISSSGNAVNSWSLGPLSQLDRAVSAIVVIGANSETQHVYTYPTLAISDIGPLITPPLGGGPNPVQEVVFCFEPFTVPSSGEATISGRALTSDGRGISSVRMSLTDLSTGEVRYAMTNPFGYYTFTEVDVANLYMVSALHKRYTFINNDRTINVEDSIIGLDFVAP